MSNKTSAGPASKPIGVFVLEDHEIVRRGIRVLLEAEPDIEVTGKASTAASALARIPALRPGVAVLDVQLPDGDRGVGLPGGPVAGAGGSLPDAHRLQRRRGAAGFDHGRAAGYVLKQIRGSDLVGAVRMVASGKSLLDARAVSQVMARLRDEADRHDPLAGLTVRERKVLELIGEGLTNRQIGERLFVR